MRLNPTTATTRIYDTDDDDDDYDYDDDTTIYGGEGGDEDAADTGDEYDAEG